MIPMTTGMFVVSDVDGERKALPRREEIPRMRPLVRRWWVVERCRRRAPRAVGRGVKGIWRLVTVEEVCTCPQSRGKDYLSIIPKCVDVRSGTPLASTLVHDSVH